MLSNRISTYTRIYYRLAKKEKINTTRCKYRSLLVWWNGSVAPPSAVVGVACCWIYFIFPSSPDQTLEALGAPIPLDEHYFWI